MCLHAAATPQNVMFLSIGVGDQVFPPSLLRITEPARPRAMAVLPLPHATVRSGFVRAGFALRPGCSRIFAGNDVAFIAYGQEAGVLAIGHGFQRHAEFAACGDLPRDAGVFGVDRADFFVEVQRVGGLGYEADVDWGADGGPMVFVDHGDAHDGAEGAFGVVFAVVDQERVAVHVLFAAVVAQEDFCRRWWRRR